MSSRRESDGHASIVRDEVSTYEAMAIVEKYECFVEYLYPILQNTPRKHAIARDAMLTALFGQVEMFISAGKSRQPSRLYSADAISRFLGSWLGHAAHADAHHLLAGLGIERTVS
jgi:hypothetical protein